MKTKNQKGITLIALIITIIVMIILVAVSVNIALNTGLFKAAQDAVKITNSKLENDTKLSNGAITVDGLGYETLDDYVETLKKGIITFKVLGKTFQVEKGLTWEQAISSLNQQGEKFRCPVCEHGGYQFNVNYLDFNVSLSIIPCGSHTGYMEDKLFYLSNGEREVKPSELVDENVQFIERITEEI